jgi:hypothetical protein|tara:strand:+ start:84 stop:740 length:657 start_codon:yes stop_codon:yes gene_type:complete
MQKINVEKLSDEFIKGISKELQDFVTTHGLKLPKITTGNGMALSAMSHNPDKYWDRESTEQFVDKYCIKTKDSIQLFNKHEQKGIKASSERGKNYLIYPYVLSTKHKMRTDFKFDGTEEQKNIEIDKIKSTIHHDYIEVDNSKWQLGHKNPDTTDSSSNNLVLQPPIQAKYRDNYIFIDTLTKIPTPVKLLSDAKAGKSPYTKEQLVKLRDGLNALNL